MPSPSPQQADAPVSTPPPSQPASLLSLHPSAASSSSPSPPPSASPSPRKKNNNKKKKKKKKQVSPTPLPAGVCDPAPNNGRHGSEDTAVDADADVQTNGDADGPSPESSPFDRNGILVSPSKDLASDHDFASAATDPVPAFSASAVPSINSHPPPSPHRPALSPNRPQLPKQPSHLGLTVGVGNASPTSDAQHLSPVAAAPGSPSSATESLPPLLNDATVTHHPGRGSGSVSSNGHIHPARPPTTSPADPAIEDGSVEPAVLPGTTPTGASKNSSPAHVAAPIANGSPVATNGTTSFSALGGPTGRLPSEAAAVNGASSLTGLAPLSEISLAPSAVAVATVVSANGSPASTPRAAPTRIPLPAARRRTHDPLLPSDDRTPTPPAASLAPAAAASATDSPSIPFAQLRSRFDSVSRIPSATSATPANGSSPQPSRSSPAASPSSSSSPTVAGAPPLLRTRSASSRPKPTVWVHEQDAAGKLHWVERAADPPAAIVRSPSLEALAADAQAATRPRTPVKIAPAFAAADSPPSSPAVAAAAAAAARDTRRASLRSRVLAAAAVAASANAAGASRTGSTAGEAVEAPNNRIDTDEHDGDEERTPRPAPAKPSPHAGSVIVGGGGGDGGVEEDRNFFELLQAVADASAGVDDLLFDTPLPSLGDQL
ncbi:hypothetical protein HK405_014142, partial [Cladochytrium tenue]